MKNFFEKFFNKHTKIERFGVSVVTLVLCFSVLLTTIGMKVHKDNQLVLGEQAIYTEQFVSSLTQTSGNVVGIYGNDDHTKIFMMLKLATAETMTMDAANYQMFLTAYESHLNVNPSGAIYMFGTTGYMGLYFADARGFEQQMLNIIVRSNKNVSELDIGDGSQITDSSSDDYDQFQIFANFGATGVTHADFLETDDKILLSDIYRECILDAQEWPIREQLQDDLSKMIVQVARMEEYENRLDQQGIVVPERPQAIRYDKIVDYKDRKKADSELAETMKKAQQESREDENEGSSMDGGTLDSISSMDDGTLDVPSAEETTVSGLQDADGGQDAQTVPDGSGEESIDDDEQQSLGTDTGANTDTDAGTGDASGTSDIGDITPGDGDVSTSQDPNWSASSSSVSEGEQKDDADEKSDDDSTSGTSVEISYDEVDVSPGAEDLLYLSTPYVVAGGYTLDWQSKLVKDGYAKELLQGKTYNQFFELKNEEVERVPFQNNGIYYRKDGTVFNGAEIPGEETIQKDIDGLNAAYSMFYSLKSTYQKDHQYKLLYLEMEKDAVDKTFTINNSEDVLTNWNADD